MAHGLKIALRGETDSYHAVFISMSTLSIYKHKMIESINETALLLNIRVFVQSAKNQCSDFLPQIIVVSVHSVKTVTHTISPSTVHFHIEVWKKEEEVRKKLWRRKC